MRALITGATGFLGRHLCRELAQRGLGFRGVARRACAADAAREHLHVFDLHDTPALRRLIDRVRPTHVFHLAAALRGGIAEGECMIRSNVTLTHRLMTALEAVRPAPVFVLPGSAAVYGRPLHLPITESHPLRPLDLYGVTKASQEHIVDLHHQAWACPVRILRIFNMVGPGQPESLLASSVARQIARAERGGPPVVEVGDLSTRRDFVDVRDVARACVDAALMDVNRALFNVCSGVSTPVRACVNELLRVSHVALDIVPQDEHRRRVEIPDHRGDPERIREALDWQATIPLSTSMADLLNSWRERMLTEPRH